MTFFIGSELAGVALTLMDPIGPTMGTDIIVADCLPLMPTATRQLTHSRYGELSPVWRRAGTPPPSATWRSPSAPETVRSPPATTPPQVRST